MRKVTRSILAMLLVVGCVSFVGLTAFAASDGNNTMEDAQYVGLNSSASGIISSDMDDDWFRFELPSNGKIKLSFSHENINSPIQFWEIILMDENYEKFDVWTSKGNETNNEFYNIGLPAGIYYVKVSDYYGSYYDVNYSLTVSYTQSEFWEQEFNYDSITATPIITNTAYYGTILGVDDRDYYRFRTERPSKVSITFSHSVINTPTNYWRVSLLTENLEAFYTYYIPGNTSNITLPNVGLPGGKYYVLVEDNYGTTVNEDYCFRVNYTETDYWEKEFNNDTLTATPIKLNTDYYGTTRNDTCYDYYIFTLSSLTNISFSFSHENLNDVSEYWDISLYDMNEKRITGFVSLGNKTSTITTEVPLGSGTYYLVVQRKDKLSTKDYKIRVSTGLATPAVNISNTNSGINVKWNSVSGATAYIIYRSTYNASNNSWSGWSTLQNSYKGTSYLDTTVVMGKKYKYTVRATNGSSKSNYKSSAALAFDPVPDTKISNVANGISVSWEQIVSAKSYAVYRSQYNSANGAWGSWSKVATPGASTTKWVDTNVKCGTTYRYTVKAVNNGVYSSAKSSNTLVHLLAPTVSFANANNGVKVSWSKIAGAKNYKIYRTEYVNGAWSSWKNIATFNSNILSCADTTVRSGVNYKYTVKAVNGNSASTYKNTSTLYYLAAPTVAIAQAPDGINIGWNNSIGATQHIIYRSTYDTRNSKWGSWTELATVNTGTTSFVDKKAKSGVTYKYTVRAVRGDYKSGYKSSNALFCLLAPDVKFSAAASGINVSWSKISGAEKYEVYRSEYSNGVWTSWQYLCSPVASATKWVDSNVKSGVYYRYTVKAIKATYTSKYNNTDPMYYLAAPTVSAQNKADGVNVSWSRPVGSTQFIVYRSQYNASTKKWSGWSVIATPNSDVLNLIDRNVANGIYYKYTVRAVNGQHKSAYKASSSLYRISAPTVKFTTASNYVNIAWTSVNVAKNYEIYRSEYSNGTWTSWKYLGAVASNVLSWKDTTARSGVYYKYTVKATRGSHSGGYYDTNPIFYLSEPVTRIVAAGSGMKIVWSAVPGAQNYRVYRSEYYNGKWSNWQNIGSAGASSTEFYDTGVRRGVTYRYTVMAVYGNSQSTFSPSNQVKF